MPNNSFSSVQGGDQRRSSFTVFSGYSETAQRTGNTTSYQEPNSQSLQITREGVSPASCRKPRRTYLKTNRGSMQKPIEGLLGRTENVEGRATIGAETVQNHVENQPNPQHPDYLKYIKGGYRLFRATVPNFQANHPEASKSNPQIMRAIMKRSCNLVFSSSYLLNRQQTASPSPRCQVPSTP